MVIPLAATAFPRRGMLGMTSPGEDGFLAFPISHGDAEAVSAARGFHAKEPRLLLRQLQTWAVLHGARQIWLEVRDSNPRARQVYERWGYIEMGRRKNYYPAQGGGREHATVMCLSLPG